MGDNQRNVLKNKIKRIISEVMYQIYQRGILRNDIAVKSVDDTIKELQRTNKSMVRFGDGEILIMEGKNLKLQMADPALAEGLRRIIGYPYEDLMVTIPEIFGDLSIYTKESQIFWKEHLLFFRKTYYKYCDKSKPYYSTSISRFYYAMKDKEQCDIWAKEIKKIWKDKNVVIVEGEKTHNGVGNDLFEDVKSIERIIGPAKDAYGKIDQIYECCKKYEKDTLFLISLGAAAKFLTEKLYLDGYRVLDIGNFDMEYEWYLQKQDKKIALKKHELITEKENEDAGYGEYLRQIKFRIES